jgi:hypothetical protein
LTEFVELRRLAVKKHRTRTVASTSYFEVEIMKLDNNNKMLSIAEEEYLQLATRLEQVADTQYMKKLKERLIALDLKIRKAEKANKLLESEKMKIDWRFENMLETGDSQITRDLNQVKSEGILINRKLKEIDAALAKRYKLGIDIGTKVERVEKTEKAENIEKLRKRWKKLLEIAEREGIKLSDMEQNKGKEVGTKWDTKRKTLLTKKETLRRNIKAIKNKYTVTAKDYTKKVSEMQKKLTPLAETVKTKQE